jgi:hypothetical protein
VLVKGVLGVLTVNLLVNLTRGALKTLTRRGFRALTINFKVKIAIIFIAIDFRSGVIKTLIGRALGAIGALIRGA